MNTSAAQVGDSSRRYPPQEDLSRPPRDGETRPVLLALILIALGVAFFVGNLYELRGATLFLAIGLAFLVARIATGRYGHAVPAGILLGFGAYVAMEETRVLNRATLFPAQEGAWFFLMLALGFLAVYVIGWQPAATWPLFPAAVLGAISLVMLGWAYTWPLAPFAWIGAYWPAALVAIGLWLLVRDALPEAIRRPIGALGTIALLAYAVLAVGAAAAASKAGLP